jgi:hypothetical protein
MRLCPEPRRRDRQKKDAAVTAIRPRAYDLIVKTWQKMQHRYVREIERASTEAAFRWASPQFFMKVHLQSQSHDKRSNKNHSKFRGLTLLPTEPRGGKLGLSNASNASLRIFDERQPRNRCELKNRQTYLASEQACMEEWTPLGCRRNQRSSWLWPSCAWHQK